MMEKYIWCGWKIYYITYAVEYVRLCGYGNGGDRKAQVQVGHVLSLEEIANQHVDCTPIGVDTKSDVTKSHSDTWTDAQIAKSILNDKIYQI